MDFKKKCLSLSLPYLLQTEKTFNECSSNYLLLLFLPAIFYLRLFVVKQKKNCKTFFNEFNFILILKNKKNSEQYCN